jgi:hypothetical protein
MLTGQIHDNNRTAILNVLMRELHRTHVSPDDLLVQSESINVLTIRDLRWPEAYGLMLIDMGGGKLKIKNDHIKNDKYRENNPEYNTHTTSDLKKIRRWLHEYTGPLDSERITRESHYKAKRIFEVWQKETAGVMNDMQRKLTISTIVLDIANYLRTGAAYQNPLIRECFDKIPAAEQYALRMSAPMPDTHLLLSTDGRVSCSRMISFSSPQKQYSGVFEGLAPTYKEKIAILKILEDKTFVEDVGVRLNDYNFWVY